MELVAARSTFLHVSSGSGSCGIRPRRGNMRFCVRATVAAPPPLEQVTASEPASVVRTAKAFAPATVANLGPCYDLLGCAVEGLGDHVSAEVDGDVPGGKVRISWIRGDDGRLTAEAERNCAGIAAQGVLQLLGVTSVGVTLGLLKGLPLGSGLGSSAASAAAACVAVNALFGAPLTKAELVTAALRSEAAVSGRHADNVAPALLGGFVLVRQLDPLQLLPLRFGAAASGPGGGPEGPSASPSAEPLFVLATPAFEAPTRRMRSVVPADVRLPTHTANSAGVAALVAAVLLGDVALLGSAMSSDAIVEPARMPLIPGMAQVKRAALRAGAAGCTISGAGPTAVALVNATSARTAVDAVGAAMVAAFRDHGKLKASFSVHRLDREGARLVS